MAFKVVGTVTDEDKSTLQEITPADPAASQVVPEDTPFLGQAYDYLKAEIPKAAKATGEFVKENAQYAGEKVHDFIYGQSPIPTLSGDIYNTIGAPKTAREAQQREIAAETAKLSGLEAMAIGTARELTNLGTRSRTGMPPGKMPMPPLARPGVMEGLEEVERQFPISHGIGATAPYLTPGFTQPLKTMGIQNIPMKSAARGLYDLGESIGSKKVKGAAIDLRLLPKNIAESPFANTVATGAGVGYLHPEMDAGEGAFYAGVPYAMGKFAYGKLGRPKNYNLPEKNDLVKWGTKKGYDIDPGVQTGDIRMQQLDQAFFRNADTAGPFQTAKLKNRDMNNKIVSRFVGRETTNISDEWFESTGKQLKARREELYNSLQAQHNPTLRRRTDNLLKDFEDVFGPQNLPGQGQYNPNWDSGFKTQVDRVWQLFQNPNNSIPMDAWKGVRGSLDKLSDSYAKRPDKSHLVPYLNDLSDVLDDMLTGSKADMAAIQRNKVQSAVRWHAMATQKTPGEIDMKALGSVVRRKYPSQLRGRQSTGNEKLDDFYNAIKLNEAMSDTHGASLGVSDRVSRLFTNPASRTAGRLGYLFSKDAHDIGALNSFIINRYRNSPHYGLPNTRLTNNNLGMGPITMDEMVGAIAGRYALSEQ